MCCFIYNIGSIGGLYEQTILRLIAYSSIANFGFIFLGFSLCSIDGIVASFYYFFIYSLGVILLFMVVSVSKNQHTLKEIKYITELYSIINYNFFIGFFALFALLSLAGVPPFPGFSAKLLILRALFIEGHYVLFFFVLIFSLVSAVYYIRIIRMLFFSDSFTYSGPLIISGNVTQLYGVIFIGLVNIWFI